MQGFSPACIFINNELSCDPGLDAPVIGSMDPAINSQGGTLELNSVLNVALDNRPLPFYITGQQCINSTLVFILQNISGLHLTGLCPNYK